MKYILLLLEFGPIASFFLITKTLDIFYATGVFMVLSIIGLTGKYIITKKVSHWLILTSLILVIMGTLTLGLKQSCFIKMKPTAVYFFSGLFCYIGALRGKVYIQDILLDFCLSKENWIILSKRVSFCCFFLAALNEVIWRVFSENIWINFKVFVTPIILYSFFMLQKSFIEKNRIEK